MFSGLYNFNHDLGNNETNSIVINGDNLYLDKRLNILIIRKLRKNWNTDFICIYVANEITHCVCRTKFSLNDSVGIMQWRIFLV